MKLKLKKKSSAAKSTPSKKTKTKTADPVKKTKADKPVPMWKRKPSENEVTVGVRWHYTHDFAKALGKGATGRGKARRNDVKDWAYATLNAAAELLLQKG